MAVWDRPTIDVPKALMVPWGLTRPRSGSTVAARVSGRFVQCGRLLGGVQRTLSTPVALKR